MSWLASIIVGVLTAIIGAIAAGTVAALAADWYRVPSREGASGFFVLGFILLALIVGFIVGIVASRFVGARPDPGFLKALGYAQLAMLGTVGVIGGIARLLADVGPTLGGKELMVNVEFRWPKGEEPPPATEQWWVELASVSGHVRRNSEEGPVWREDARLEDGYWIVPGAVNLYTSRGDRILSLRPDSISPMGYLANIPAWPGRRSLEWSEWYPKQRAGGPPLPHDFKFRYRLVQAGSPIRTQRFGDFEVVLQPQSVGSVTYGNQGRTWSAYGTFSLRYKGKPLSLEGRAVEGESVQRYTEVGAAALLPGESSALLVLVNSERGYGEITLLRPDGDSVRSEYVAHGQGIDAGTPLTNDSAVFQRLSGYISVEGRVDLIAYASPGLYLFNDAILDTRTRTVRRLTLEQESNVIERIHPLGVSPDELSYVRLAYDPDVNTFGESHYVAQVTNTVTGERYRLPLDKYAMRWGDIDDLTPLHVNHYFTWTKGKDGHDRLVAREKVRPPPYQGRTKVEEDYQEYRVMLAAPSLRPAVIEWLVTEFKGEALSQEGLSDFSREVRVDGKVVHVSYGTDDRHVGIWMDRGKDVSLVSMIGDRLNATLATGRFDAHFVTSVPAEE
ncbi:MAG TPA: hypothetical protein VG817_06720 [Gemmatimonadales bacterium]|nr:hypothetical protein [Gemmatimonadales bacterium]